MANDSEAELADGGGGTCEVCSGAKALLSQATHVDSAIVSFNCGHGVTEIMGDAEANILKPISMNTITNELSRKFKTEDPDLKCLVCSETYPSVKNGEKSPLLSHLLTSHKLVIADVDKIADFNRYIRYWKDKFQSVEDITKYCVVINSNMGSNDIDPSEKYYLLTDFLPEDEKLRKELNTEKLCKILDEQQSERADMKFSRSCLFCKVMFHGNRAELFKHMAVEHTFNVGNADNIVHAGEFIDQLRSKLDNFVCLFCEKEFKDWTMLKDHMRKKGHKRIDPKNQEYDKFYLINYLDPGKNWKELQTEPEYEKEDSPSDEDIMCNEKDWEDWTESRQNLSLCLFCSKTDEDVNAILQHMKAEHSFDLNTIKVQYGLSFYHQVKIVNYIRKHVYQNKCPSCLHEFECRDELNEHFFTERHYALPEDRSVWDQSAYFFPTFDDDSLLCYLEDDTEEDENRNITS